MQCLLDLRSLSWLTKTYPSLALQKRSCRTGEEWRLATSTVTLGLIHAMLVYVKSTEGVRRKDIDWIGICYNYPGHIIYSLRLNDKDYIQPLKLYSSRDSVMLLVHRVIRCRPPRKFLQFLTGSAALQIPGFVSSKVENLKAGMTLVSFEPFKLI